MKICEIDGCAIKKGSIIMRYRIKVLEVLEGTSVLVFAPRAY